jgi:hypothetical protein|tara:strand:- start:73 stop:294 length:222 start_codon:yes stop_codon:yes gene_type:complete
MVKRKYKKGIESLQWQLEDHIRKFNEAKARLDDGAMEYMAREMAALIEEKQKREIKLLPRRKRIKLKKRLKKR